MSIVLELGSKGIGWSPFGELREWMGEGMEEIIDGRYGGHHLGRRVQVI